MGSLLSSGNGDHPTQWLSIFDPASPQAESIRSLAILVLVITGLIFLVVEGVLLYTVVRFRRGPSAVTIEPPQVYGSKPIEIAWTAAPALIVFLLVLVTIRTLWEVKANPPSPRAGDDAVYLTVIGHQWWWEYVYEHAGGRKLGLVTANELHVPASVEGASRPIYLNLQSADVAHSFWVPRLGGKTDLIPGRVNRAWFQAETPGLYVGQCAEYCGTQHANMLLRVVVDTPQDFTRWLEDEQKPAVDDPSAQEGKRAFLGLSCVNCHAVRGTPAAGTFGPDLTHLMRRRTIAGGMIPNTPENLRRWIADPQGEKPGCLMPAFGLNRSDLDLVVRYLLTLR